MSLIYVFYSATSKNAILSAELESATATQFTTFSPPDYKLIRILPLNTYPYGHQIFKALSDPFAKLVFTCSSFCELSLANLHTQQMMKSWSIIAYDTIQNIYLGIK